MQPRHTYTKQESSMLMLLIFFLGAYLGLLTAALLVIAGHESDIADNTERVREQFLEKRVTN